MDLSAQQIVGISEIVRRERAKILESDPDQTDIDEETGEEKDLDVYNPEEKDKSKDKYVWQFSIEVLVGNNLLTKYSKLYKSQKAASRNWYIFRKVTEECGYAMQELPVDYSNKGVAQ